MYVPKHAEKDPREERRKEEAEEEEEEEGEDEDQLASAKAADESCLY